MRRTPEEYSQLELWRESVRPSSLHAISKRVVNTIKVGGLFDEAAALGYWNLLALFPFAIVTLTLMGFIPLKGLDEELRATLYRFLPGDAASLIEKTLNEVVGKQHGWLLVLALVGALWTASGAVSALVDALNRDWEVEETRPYWKVKLLALGVTLSGSLLLVVSLVALVVGPQFAHHVWAFFGVEKIMDAVWAYLRWPLVLVGMMGALSLAYWILPNVRRCYRFITPGAVFATLLWLAASFGFGLYAAHFGSYSKVYGTLGGAVVLLTWLYLSGVAVIFGGLVNATLDRSIGVGHERKRKSVPRPVVGTSSRPPLPV